MELKLQLGVFVLLIQVSLVVCQRVTLKKGQTLNLSCPVTNAHKTNVDWKNPEGYIMFFNRNQGEDNISSLQDKRYSITKLSESEFAISVSNVTFKDGGNYTCTHYGDRTTEMKVEVIVLGHPKMSVTKHEGKFVIKCTAEGNHYPPQISWKLDHGPEILGHAQVLHQDKTYISTDMLHVRSLENRVTVKCLVHHPALHSQHLMNFVKIGRESTKPWHTTTASSTTARPQRSTEGQRTTTGWVRHGRTTAYLSTKLSTVPSNRPNMVTSSGPPLSPPTSTGSHLNTSDNSTVLPGSTKRRNDTISNTTSTTDWTSVSEPTETITSSNNTEGNGTGSSNDPKTQTGSEGSSSLLVFLVTCLIFCLLVVVIFFAIKLRRAHMAWKRENEDSDPSEESSKSKSSQEERNAQGQRRRGLFHTAFTQYVVEKPAVITSVINTDATESENTEQTSQPQTLEQTLVRSDIKETEL